MRFLCWLSVAFIVGLCPTPLGAEEPRLYRARFDSRQTYHLHVPEGSAPSGGWPLFIFVHGTYASGVGDFQMWQRYADQERFLLLAPNFTDEYDRFPRHEDDALLQLIRQLNVQYGVDEAKILIGGFSRGGVFAFRFAFAHPHVPKVVAVLNGAPYLPSVEPGAGPRGARFYLSAGSAEPNTAQRAQRTAEDLRRRGYQADVRIAPGMGHTISPQAVMDVVRLVQEMKGE